MFFTGKVLAMSLAIVMGLPASGTYYDSLASNGGRALIGSNLNASEASVSLTETELSKQGDWLSWIRDLTEGLKDTRIKLIKSFDHPILLYSASQDRIKYGNEAGQVGYLNYSGDVVIPPEYDYGRDFYEDVALVSKNGQERYIDPDGRTLFYKSDVLDQYAQRPEYINIGDFNDGYATAGDGNNWSYIDKSGHFVFPPGTFLDVENFSEGLAQVHDTNGNRYFINQKLEKAFDSHSSYGYSSFSEGLAAFVNSEVKLYGYVDPSGQVAITPKFEYASDFVRGYAVVMEKGMHGVIDKNGTYVIEPKYETIGRTNAGQFLIHDGVGTLYMTRELKPVFRLSDSDSFYYGMGHKIFGRDGNYRVYDLFMNKLGTWKSYFDLGDGLYFVNGTCLVDMKDIYRGDYYSLETELDQAYRFKFVNTGGDTVIELDGYDAVRPFKEGLARVKKNGKYGYIDKNGQLVIEPKYTMADDFYQGHAYVVLDGRYFFIDEKEEEYKEADIEFGLSNDYEITYNQGLTGVFEKASGKQILENEYVSVTQEGVGLFVITDGAGRTGFFNARTKTLVEPIYNSLYFCFDKYAVASNDYYELSLLNLEGIPLNEDIYELLYPLGENLLYVSKEGKEGLLDKYLNPVLPIENDYITSTEISQRYLGISFKKGEKTETIVYDSLTENMVDKTFSGRCLGGSETAIVVELDDGTLAVKDYGGRTIYETLDTFLEADNAFVLFTTSAGNHYLVDGQGQVFLKDQSFDSIEMPVENGAVVAETEKGTALFDLYGEPLTTEFYDYCRGIDSGIATLIKNGTTYYVNEKGVVLLSTEERFKLEPFSEGLGLVTELE